MDIRRPGPGWRHIAGPVYDHETGLRIHVAGIARLHDGTLLSGTMWPEVRLLNKCIRVCGGNRKRGVMVWALRASKTQGGAS